MARPIPLELPTRDPRHVLRIDSRMLPWNMPKRSWPVMKSCKASTTVAYSICFERWASRRGTRDCRRRGAIAAASIRGIRNCWSWRICSQRSSLSNQSDDSGDSRALKSIASIPNRQAFRLAKGLFWNRDA